MEQREVLVTLISASDLKKVSAFGKMTVYCVAWIYPTVKVSSPMDKKGNLNPTWNATLKLMADERLVEDGNAVLVIDLYDHGTFGNKSVGSCTIPLSGLKAPASTTEGEEKGKEDKGADKMPAISMEGGSSSSSASFMAVPILTKSGKAKGTLNLSIKLGELLKYPHPQMAAPPAPAFQQQEAMPGYENKDVDAAPGAAPVYAYPAAGYPPAYGQPGYGPPGGAQPGYGPPGGAQPYPMYQQAAYPGQMPPPYYPPGGYAPPPPPPQQKRRSGLGGGLGAGLAGGALGGLLIGSMLGGDGGGDGGGCGGGGCGGGCGG